MSNDADLIDAIVDSPPANDVWGADSICIAELADSIAGRLQAILADADTLAAFLVPPGHYRASEARHSVANGIERASAAASDFRRTAELLKGIEND